MMELSVSNEYTSVACNRTPEILDWNSDGEICFGAANAVALFGTNKKGGNLITILSHHKSQINSVKWIKNTNGPSTEFITCSADDTAAIWTLCDSSYKVSSSLTGHLNGVTAVSGVYLNEKQDLSVFTTSIDSTIKVWERRNGVTLFKQTINLNSGLCLTLHAHLLPQSCKPLLLCALDDHKIHLYASEAVPGAAGDADGDVYQKVHTLSGHEDWVRGLDVMDVEGNSILVVSCSQDTYIRLWKIQQYQPEMDQSTGIKTERRLMSAYGVQYSVHLDAVLAGHEGWVYGVHWAPPDKATQNPTYRLLSSSLDKTLIIWEPESLTPAGQPIGAWTERVRVGEVGGNGLGYYGSQFGPQGDSIVGHGYNGSLHIWKCNKETKQWEPAVVCGGHFSSVEDLGWEPRGRYLISVSADQTTRLHGPWRRDDAPPEWHELARPQVHGYDMSSVAPLDGVTFASAAEEKVIRVFRAPHNFVSNFSNIAREDLGLNRLEICPQGASVPSLGLSNKAVFSDEEQTLNDSDDSNAYFVNCDLHEPPTEETLMQNTLWPETQKLYGHGFEVFALAGSPDAAFLASACKASTAEHAAVIIWDTSTWQQIQKLQSHTLTVTQLAFSPDSTKLLTVSRDRRWTLYQRVEGTKSFEQVACTDKSNGVHSRIIWCCAWTADSCVFATGSRDAKVCLWTKSDQQQNQQLESSLKCYQQLGGPLQTNVSVTALAFANVLANGCRMLAVGDESGQIAVYSFGHDCSWTLLTTLDNSAAHHMTVKRLMFQPTQDSSCVKNKRMLLASCGADHLVRIYNLTVNKYAD